MTLAELTRLIQEAKAAVAKSSHLVAAAQKQVAKWQAKYAHADHQAKALAKKPKRHAFWVERRARAKRKVHFWTQKEADAIEVAKDWKAALARRIAKKKAALQPKGGAVVAHALKYVDVQEGSALQRSWAAKLGYSASLPWCSIFAANMLIEAGVASQDQLPPNPAYSGSWIGWSRGRRVSRSEARPGDLLIFDWGDGGITDHVAIYAGGDQKIGGNENDRVEHDAVPWSNVVAVVRPV